MLISLFLLNLTSDLQSNQIQFVEDVLSRFTHQLEFGSVDVVGAGHNDLRATPYEILGHCLDDLRSLE